MKKMALLFTVVLSLGMMACSDDKDKDDDKDRTQKTEERVEKLKQQLEGTEQKAQATDEEAKSLDQKIKEMESAQKSCGADPQWVEANQQKEPQVALEEKLAQLGKEIQTTYAATVDAQSNIAAVLTSAISEIELLKTKLQETAKTAAATTADSKAKLDQLLEQLRASEVQARELESQNQALRADLKKHQDFVRTNFGVLGLDNTFAEVAQNEPMYMMVVYQDKIQKSEVPLMKEKLLMLHEGERIPQIVRVDQKTPIAPSAPAVIPEVMKPEKPIPDAAPSEPHQSYDFSKLGHRLKNWLGFGEDSPAAEVPPQPATAPEVAVSTNPPAVTSDEEVDLKLKVIVKTTPEKIKEYLKFLEERSASRPQRDEDLFVAVHPLVKSTVTTQITLMKRNEATEKPTQLASWTAGTKEVFLPPEQKKLELYRPETYLMQPTTCFALTTDCLKGVVASGVLDGDEVDVQVGDTKIQGNSRYVLNRALQDSVDKMKIAWSREAADKTSMTVETEPVVEDVVVTFHVNSLTRQNKTVVMRAVQTDMICRQQDGVEFRPPPVPAMRAKMTANSPDELMLIQLEEDEKGAPNTTSELKLDPNDLTSTQQRVTLFENMLEVLK